MRLITLNVDHVIYMGWRVGASVVVRPTYGLLGTHGGEVVHCRVVGEAQRSSPTPSVDARPNTPSRQPFP